MDILTWSDQSNVHPILESEYQELYFYHLSVINEEFVSLVYRYIST